MTYVSEAMRLLPAMLDGQPVRVIMQAIQLQEDPDKRRRQWPTGPARGLFQFESGGGVHGVMTHAQTSDLARWVCLRRRVPWQRTAIWEALERDDALAAAFARLNLWWDPRPLPRLGDVQGAFSLYLRTWRPGAYTRGDEAQRAGLAAKFKANYQRAAA